MNKKNKPANPVVLIDNYDSFTYNLVQYFGALGIADILLVLRNDQYTATQIMQLSPAALVFSPGPCTPDKAGVSLALIEQAVGIVPIFGVCLGMQSIVQALGGKICRAPQVMHGKSSKIRNDGQGIFKGLPSLIRMGRYHSLIADPTCMPTSIEVSARSADAEKHIMAIRVTNVDAVIEAVQFHPESILSQYGHKLLANFLEIALSGTTFSNQFTEQLDARMLP